MVFLFLKIREPIFNRVLVYLMHVKKNSRLTAFICCLIWALALGTAPLSRASTLWTGPTIIYNQPTPDPTQVSNQDRITPVVWLTRATSKGLFNAFSETNAGTLSPADTEWAFGTPANYATLHYTNWLMWLNGASPTSLVGKQVMLHLISEDIYISLEFTLWASGNVGGFTYQRSTAPLVISNATAGNGQFSFHYVAVTNYNYVIQYSVDLINWQLVATNAASANPMSFSESMDSMWKFYRVVCLSGP
jgi:hypothetical protein